MTTSSEKEFDAVAMKRRAAQRIHERLKDRSRDERRAYWQERTEALRHRQEQTRGDRQEAPES
jgi:hypothetical protein